MGDREISEPMEEPQNDSGAAKIDMSLDEIIKLNKKEQKASGAADRARGRRLANRTNVLRKLSQTLLLQRRGALQHQGPSRSRGLNRTRGLGRGSGLSPLKRPSTTSEELVHNTTPARGSYRGRGRGRGRGALSRGALSARGQRAPSRGGRPFILDRGFGAASGKLGRYQKIQSLRPEASAGTMLTVSLSNTKSEPATQVRRGGASSRRGGTVLRGRSSEVVSSMSTPKGIPLRFNYKATSNQTQLSLNDRFTGLRIRGRGSRADWKSESGRGRGQIRVGRGGGIRGVISGGGRGRGRGMTRRGMAVERGGRGSARGRGGARGSGRTVFLQ